MGKIVTWDGAKYIEKEETAVIPSLTVVEETQSGLLPNAGTSLTYARGDHTHGTPGIPNRFAGYYIDFLSSGNLTQHPWIGAAVIGGTAIMDIGAVNHPGVMHLRSSSSTNSGYWFRLATTALLISGSESTDFVFRPVTTTSVSIRLGFLDTATVTSPVDGVWLNNSNGVLTGRTRNNNIESTTATSFTLVNDTWYRGRIVINSDATRADFYLYAEAGTLLWTSFLTANIPKTTGRETGHGIIANSTADLAARTLVHIDYMSIFIDRILIR